MPVSVPVTQTQMSLANKPTTGKALTSKSIIIIISIVVGILALLGVSIGLIFKFTKKR